MSYLDYRFIVFIYAFLGLAIGIVFAKSKNKDKSWIEVIKDSDLLKKYLVWSYTLVLVLCAIAIVLYKILISSG
jgi:hypothetical protein